MSKINDFLTELEEELRFLKPKDAVEVLKFYRDKINIQNDYGTEEEKIIAGFPSPKKIAEDIYKSKGKTYLDNRKKQVNRQNKLKAIFYGILIVMLAVGLVSIIGFLVVNIYQLIRLFVLSFGISAFFDKLTLLLFVLVYIAIIVIAGIYIFDLIYIFISHFLYPILLEISKKDREYKFLSFTISGAIEDKSKKKNFLGKILIGLVIGMIVLGLGNTISKGYIYRSNNNYSELKEEVKVLGLFNEIVVEESTTFVKIKTGDIGQLTINYYNEFNNKLSYSVEDNKLVIHPIKLSTFDLFGFLDEPLSTLEIIVPYTMELNKVDINLSDGYFDIVDLDREIDFTLKGENSTFAITRCNINSINVTGVNLNIASENNVIGDVNLTLQSGRYCAVKDTYDNLIVKNHLADFILQEANIDTINIDASSAKTAIDKIITDSITFKDTNSESLLRNVHANSAVIESVANSDTSIEGMIAKDSLTISGASSVIEGYYIKTPTFKVDVKRGHLNLYNINKDTVTSNDTDEFLTKYNYYKTLLSLEMKMYLADCEFISSSFDNMSLDLQEGTLDISYSYIKESNIKFADTTVNLIDVDGVLMNVDVNGGIFSYDNENITSNIIVYVTGELIKTDIYISDDIKRGEIE